MQAICGGDGQHLGLRVATLSGAGSIWHAQFFNRVISAFFNKNLLESVCDYQLRLVNPWSVWTHVKRGHVHAHAPGKDQRLVRERGQDSADCLAVNVVEDWPCVSYALCNGVYTLHALVDLKTAQRLSTSA